MKLVGQSAPRRYGEKIQIDHRSSDESDRASFMEAKGSGNYMGGREARAPTNHFSALFCGLTRRLFGWQGGRAATVLERARGG